MATSDLLNVLNKEGFNLDVDLEGNLPNIAIQQLDPAADNVSGRAVKWSISVLINHMVCFFDEALHSLVFTVFFFFFVLLRFAGYSWRLFCQHEEFPFAGITGRWKVKKFQMFR